MLCCFVTDITIIVPMFNLYVGSPTEAKNLNPHPLKL
jgi:hypothetical protein